MAISGTAFAAVSVGKTFRITIETVRGKTEAKSGGCAVAARV